LWADFKSVLHGTAPALGLRAWEMCHHSIADQPRKGELTMSFQSWLQNLRFAFAPARAQRHYRRRDSLRAATYRPNLEVLEDRLTPSVYWGGDYPIDEYYLTATYIPLNRRREWSGARADFQVNSFKPGVNR